MTLGQFLDSKPHAEIIIDGIDILEHYPLYYFKYNSVVIKIKQKEDVYITSSFCFRYAHHDQYKYRRIRMPAQVVYRDQNRPH